MNKETRKDVEETFASLGKILSQVNSADVLVKSTPGVDELLAKAKEYSKSFDVEVFEIRRDSDLRLDVVKAIEAIEKYQFEAKQGRVSDEWLNIARERIRGVNDQLKDWVV